MSINSIILSTEKIFQTLGLDSVESIPNELILRNQNTLWFAMFGLTASFILLAVSKSSASNVIQVFSKVIYKNSNVLKMVKEEYSLTSISSFILLFNFTLTTSILLYLSYLHFNQNNNFYLFYFLPILPLYFFVWPMICFNVVGFLTQGKEYLKENKFNNILLAQITGVIFSLLLLIWTFNIKWSEYLILVFFGIMFLFWIFKIFRGIFFAIKNGIAWYYIFLYFCTLEILPIVLLFSVYSSKIDEFWSIV